MISSRYEQIKVSILETFERLEHSYEGCPSHYEDMLLSDLREALYEVLKQGKITKKTRR